MLRMDHVEFKFQIGEILKDEITGFVGVVMARSDYYTGCLQYGLQSRKLNEKGTTADWEWIDEIRLKSTKGKVKFDKILRKKSPGGPAPHAPQMN